VLIIYSFFKTLFGVRAPEFDMSELETLFSAASPASNEKGGKSNRRASGQKVEKVQLVCLFINI